jgi:hypothetical protein
VKDNTKAKGVHGVQHSAVVLVAALEFDPDLLVEAVHGELHKSTLHDVLKGLVVIRGYGIVIFTHARIITHRYLKTSK